MKKEFRTDMEQECNHQWEVDNGSGYNTVDMSINEKQAKWDIKVKAGEAKHRRLLGNTLSFYFITIITKKRVASVIFTNCILHYPNCCFTYPTFHSKVCISQ